MAMATQFERRRIKVVTYKSDWIFPYLPAADILKVFRSAPGNELKSGKLENPESSAALVANTFGCFLHKAGSLPELPAFGAVGWPAQRVALEECLRFPWRGGLHPWLDVVIETNTHLIGIESKRFEPFRKDAGGRFSKTYWRQVWGEAMAPFEALRDRLDAGSLAFGRLDAFQLVKHALGQWTQAGKRGVSPVLVYLYAEPSRWPDGRTITLEPRQQHQDEISTFAQAVEGAEVRFAACSFRELPISFLNSSDPELVEHAERVNDVFQPCGS